MDHRYFFEEEPLVEAVAGGGREVGFRAVLEEGAS
jgi:hypothetical protein